MCGLDATTEDSAKSRLCTQPRHARIGSHQETSLGVCIFLSAVDLRELGVDLNGNDVIEYQINEVGNDRVLEISGTDSARSDTHPTATTD